ncbi:isochorismate synthase [Calidifontibacillus oryziterrae]|uniref:isochorismate synthase n=1 Tax=Calidifontibacillus oryziterrae TaxID=1191699 RepID=UPI0002FCE5F5|nr:isochorismate synthase [Calidifontibacillus oryziterrae]
MITIQHQGLHDNIAIGVEQAKALSRSILVSHSIHFNSNEIDPIAFFARGNAWQRTFWSDPNGQFILVGIGDSYIFDANTDNDFKKLEQDWLQLLTHSVVDPVTKISGVGPVLMGAFSFDPVKKKSTLWRHFPNVKMTVPKHLLTIKNNDVWLTINMVVHPNTNTQQVTSQLLDEQNYLIQANSLPLGQVLNSPLANPLTIEEVAKEEWLAAVKQITTEIRNHEIEKVVLAREIRVKSIIERFSIELILQQLKQEQPSSYIFAIESGPDCFIGASPERLIKKEGNQAFTTCLAGSIARGTSEAEDDILGHELLTDEKNLIEHEVVVRAIKGAFLQGCEKVEVPSQPILYKVRDIQHLYTPVIGQVKQGVSLLTLVEKLHPTPALGGYPRERALQRIRELESLDRGLYAGPVGWLDGDGNGEFAVAIRSGLIQGNEASLFAGCGLVGDSDPISEYQETEMKFRPMLSALGGSI